MNILQCLYLNEVMAVMAVLTMVTPSSHWLIALQAAANQVAATKPTAAALVTQRQGRLATAGAWDRFVPVMVNTGGQCWWLIMMASSSE